MPNDMAHLHLHSSYSILDAISKIPDIVKRIDEYGHKSIALTDHGTISGVPEMYRECMKRGIKSIPSCEFYMVPDAAQYRADGNRMSHHLILLAMDDEGWKNIKLLNTAANQKFYYVPRIDYKDLRKHSNGIICMSACLKGIVPYNISIEKYDEAARHAKELKSIFGDRFYLETQDGGIDIQPTINAAMRALGERLEIPIVGCQDAHYVDRNDVVAHEAIWAIRTRDTFDKPVGYGKGKEFRPYYSTREFWLKGLQHMINEPLTTQDGSKRKSDLLESEVAKSLEIADRCKQVHIETKMHLPKYEFVPEVALGCATDSCESLHIPEGEGEVVDLTSFNYLVELVTEGYEKRYKRPFFDSTAEHRARLQKELTDIKDAKLADYFLIVWDIVTNSKSKNIPVGPGRGSAAGSMVSYCLGITGIDPLKYGLIWERFFNRGRIGTLADIDLDLPMSKRDAVIDYMRNRFGENRVAQMVTFNTLATKAALKDTAKVLGKRGMSFEDANVMTRFVPDKPKNIQDAVDRSPNLKEYEEKNESLFKIAKKIEGCPKSSGKHAAGILISDTPFDEGSIPLRWDTKKKELITEYDGDTLSDLGYLKVDILGLKTLDVLHNTIVDVNKRNKKEKKK
jgi:DNA polymerase III subunit alpha